MASKQLMLQSRLQSLYLVILSCLLAVVYNCDAAPGCPFSANLGRRSLKQAAGASLEFGFYDATCPSLDQIVSDKIASHSLEDIDTPGKILRLFFHDCVAAGCDASILLNSTASMKAEKNATISATLGKFYVIEDIKAAAEKACPGIVSCADILALAAVHSVRMAGGPVFAIDLGRRDGRTSYAATATASVPLSTMKVDALLANFAKVGLNQNDLVALSGAHTIGEIHCTNFADRYKGKSPFPDAEFGLELYNFCSRNGAYPNFASLNLRTFMDLQSPNLFDSQYYVALVSGRGIMTSDQVLFNDARTKPMVKAFAANRTLFFNSFETSLLKLGRQGVLTGTKGVIRKRCDVSP